MATIPVRLQNETEKQYIQRLTAAMAQMQTELEQKSKPATITCKVSEKGAVSVYGLQRMPVTLYAEQWTRLKAFMPTLEAFIEANDSKLAKKGDKKPDAVQAPTPSADQLAAALKMLQGQQANA